MNPDTYLMRWNPFLNQNGLGLIQVMVLSAVLMAISAYTISKLDNQNSLNQTSQVKERRSVFMREITEALTLENACANTLNQAGPLDNNMSFAALKGGDDRPVYQAGREYFGVVLKEFLLTDYPPATNGAPRYVEATLKVKVTASERSKMVGGREIIFNIPVHMMMNGNVVVSCQSDIIGNYAEAYEAACREVGGTYNVESSECEFTGSESFYLSSVANSICPEGEECHHPYRNRECDGRAPGSMRENNWVFKGFNPSGDPVCECLARACPDPTMFCAGTDLGDNWCGSVCPLGASMAPNCLTGLQREIASQPAGGN